MALLPTPAPERRGFGVWWGECNHLPLLVKVASQEGKILSFGQAA